MHLYSAIDESTLLKIESLWKKYYRIDKDYK